MTNKSVSETSNTNNTDVQLHGGNANTLNLFSDDGITKATVLLDRLIRSPKSGIKDVNDGIAVLLKAQELNLPFTTCVEHVHIINGKTGVDVHVLKALMLRAGITWNCVEDYIPLYEYTDSINVYNEWELPEFAVKCKNAAEAEKIFERDNTKIGVYPVTYYKDANGNIYKQYHLTDQFEICASIKQMQLAANNKKRGVMQCAAVPLNYRVTYEFERVVNTPNGFKVVKSVSVFTYLEAYSAGHFDKDTYKKYPKIMVKVRAFTYGARDIASDIVFGCMETTELKIVNNLSANERDVIDIESELL